MARDDYSDLSADEATRLLGAFYQRQMDILRDKNKGYLRTTFGLVAGIAGANLMQLRDLVLEKNGIEKIQADHVCHNYLPEIVAVVEARGSDAALSIKRYNQFVSDCEARARYVPAPEFTGPLSGLRAACLRIKTRLDIAKTMS